jgi:hypothetical protein
VSDEGEADPVDNVSISLIFMSSIDLNIKLIGPSVITCMYLGDCLSWNYEL